jgi:hypothetical protein
MHAHLNIQHDTVTPVVQNIPHPAIPRNRMCWGRSSPHNTSGALATGQNWVKAVERTKKTNKNKNKYPGAAP